METKTRTPGEEVGHALLQIALIPLTLTWAIVKGIVVGVLAVVFFWAI